MNVQARLEPFRSEGRKMQALYSHQDCEAKALFLFPLFLTVQLLAFVVWPLSAHAELPLQLFGLPSNQQFQSCSLFDTPPFFAWQSTEIFKAAQIQFSKDNFATVSLKAKVQRGSTRFPMRLKLWKKVLLLAGPSGGTVYWRVVGTRSDKTKQEGDVSTFTIGAPQPVGEPSLRPTSRVSRPTLSWQNNCNTKSIVWFGNDTDFAKRGTRKKSLAFKSPNPTTNGGQFTRELTAKQWRSIRKLAGDLGGSTLYWYVDSRDRLRRHIATDVMSFVLTDQDTDASSPDEVVRKFLQAQVAGDIDGAMSKLALGTYGVAGDQHARTLLEAVKRNVTATDLVYEHRATAYSTDRSLAIVRFSHRLTANLQGELHELAYGSMAILKNMSGEWKIISFAADDPLNLELFMESGASDLESSASELTFRAPSRRAAHVDNEFMMIRELNARIDAAFQKTYFDPEKLAADMTYSGIGAATGAGDLISSLYTATDIYQNFKEIVSDYRQGNTGSAIIGVEQLGVGLLQIIFEVAPGWDHLTDALAANIDQFNYNIRMHRALLILKIRLLKLSLHGPRYLFATFKGYDVPNDDIWITRPALTDWPINRGSPLTEMFFITDASVASQRPLAFEVGALWVIDSSEGENIYRAAKELNLEFNDAIKEAYVPVSLTHLAHGTLTEGRKAGTAGAQVLTGFTPGGSQIRFDVDCVRGEQLLSILLSDNTSTAPVLVRNDVFNVVTRAVIRAPGAQTLASLQLKEGESLTDLRILGDISPAGTLVTGEPDLTGLPCATLGIKDSAIASLQINGLYPNATLSIKGLKRGVTSLEVVLKGGGGEAGDSVTSNIPIEVGDIPKSPWEILITYSSGTYSTTTPEYVYWNFKPAVLSIYESIDGYDGTRHLTVRIDVDNDVFFGMADNYSHSAEYTYSDGTVWHQKSSSSFSDSGLGFSGKEQWEEGRNYVDGCYELLTRVREISAELRINGPVGGFNWRSYDIAPCCSGCSNQNGKEDSAYFSFIPLRAP